MISPMCRGHRGGTLSITSSRGSGSRGRSGAHRGHTRAGACCGGRGVGGGGGDGGSDVGSKRVAGGRRRRLLVHPRPEGVSSSRLCHPRTRRRAAKEEEMMFFETERMICEVKMKWNKGL